MILSTEVAKGSIMNIKRLILLVLSLTVLSTVGWGQCGRLTLNPITGLLDCVSTTAGTGLADPGANGPITRTALNVTAPATAGDISAVLQATGGGTAQAQTATYSPVITALIQGLQVCWLPLHNNTGAAPTFSPNGLTAHAIVKQAGAALVAGDIATTAEACAVYNLAATQWELQNPQTISIPASNFPTLTLATNVLTWGANCTVAIPCLLGPSSNPVSFTGALGSVSAPTGNGALYFYIAYDGTASVGYPAGVTALTCTTCTAVPSITAFPEASIAMYNDTVTSNSFGTPSASLQAAAYGYEKLFDGVGISSTVSGNTRTINSIPVPTTTGTSVTLSGYNQYFACTSTCTITVPVPAAGVQYCVFNDDNVATVITLSAIGSSARYENTARTAYGTAGTGTFVSGGAVGDQVCIVGRDSTHYFTLSHTGTWVAN